MGDGGCDVSYGDDGDYGGGAKLAGEICANPAPDIIRLLFVPDLPSILDHVSRHCRLVVQPIPSPWRWEARSGQGEGGQGGTEQRREEKIGARKSREEKSGIEQTRPDQTRTGQTNSAHLWVSNH